MAFLDPARPFGVAWLSESLYRVHTGPDPLLDGLGDLSELLAELGGTRLEVDGWDDALDDAWEEVATASPEVKPWVAAYVAARGEQGLTVSFGDTTRIVGRRGYGDFLVSYPAALLMADADDKVAAMRTAILTVMDRHVEKQSLDVPLLSTVCAAR